MKLFLATLLLFSSASFAGGWTNITTPTRIDIERDHGFMVYGEFGNPAGCVKSDAFYVPIEHPQFDKIYDAVLTAFNNDKKVEVYIHTCESVTWFATSSETWNYMSTKSTLNLSK